MSASDPTSSIFLTDSDDTIKTKVNVYIEYTYHSGQVQDDSA